MRPLDVHKGQEIFTQDEPGDAFYIVESGRYEIRVDGKKVLEEGPGGSFGELALLYKKPRAASIVAASDGRLWLMDEVAFLEVLAKIKSSEKPMSKKYLDFIGDIPEFQGLNSFQLEQVGRALAPRWFPEGAEILNLDGASFEERLIVLRAGTMRALVREEDGSHRQIAYYDQPGVITSADTLREASGGLPTKLESGSSNTVVLCMSTLTLQNVVNGCRDPIGTEASKDGAYQQAIEQCVCM